MRIGLIAATTATLALASQATHAAADWNTTSALRAAQLRAAQLRTEWHTTNHPTTTVEPTLRAGKILTSTVDVTQAPGQATIALALNQGTVGLDSITIFITSPDGQHSVGATAYQPIYPSLTKEILPIQVAPNGTGFTLYSEPGAWTVSQITLTAKDGTFIPYNGAALAALFGNKATVTVTNPGTPDTTPPTFGRGKLLTRTVSLSKNPVVASVLEVADDLSGVHTVSIGAIQTGGGQSGYANSELFAPVQKGNVYTSTTLAPITPTGSYTINQILVCDVAGNCNNDTNPADIKAAFGTTTFVVTP